MTGQVISLFDRRLDETVDYRVDGMCMELPQEGSQPMVPPQ